MIEPMAASTLRSTDFDLSVLQTETEWDAIAPEWNRLTAQCSGAAVFSTWEWLRPWWRHYRRAGDRLYIVTARSGGELVGVAPLYRRSIALFGLPIFERLGFVGDDSGDSEYLDFIYDDRHAPRVIEVLTEKIFEKETPWQVCELRMLPPESPTPEVVQRSASVRGWKTDLYHTSTFAVLLPDTWEEYLCTLRPRFRTKIRSLLRKLSDNNTWEISRCSSVGELEPTLSSLFSLHQERWTREGEAGSFASDARRRFYTDMACGLLEKNRLHFYTLFHEGEPISHEFSFEYKKKMYFLQQSFDCSRPKLSPGTALKANVIRECIAAGIRVYDFLGGDDPYKQNWGVSQMSIPNIDIYRKDFRASAAYYGPKALLALKKALHEYVPETWMSRSRERLRRIREMQNGHR